MKLITLLVVLFFAVLLLAIFRGLFHVIYLAARNKPKTTFGRSLAFFIYLGVLTFVLLSCAGWSWDGLKANWELLFL